MEPSDEKDKPAEATPETEQPSSAPTEDSSQAPADALSRTPDDLEEEQTSEKKDAPESASVANQKKLSTFKRLTRRVNVYFLAFILLVIIAAVITAVVYLNSQKTAPVPNIATQTLTADALKQLANNDVMIGGSSQTLTIQGNAIIDGQTLARGKLDVAGTLQSSGKITGPSLTISGTSNLGATQIKSLRVQGSTAIKGDTTLANLNVAGTSTFNGAVTASQITVSSLLLSGNAKLEIPNHIRFSGPTPSRSIDRGVLGSGGSAAISGSDTSGTVDINTGGSPAAGCFVRVTFRTVFTNKPHVIISPVGSAAGQTTYYVNRDQAGFSICVATGAPAHKSFSFDYFVTN